MFNVKNIEEVENFINNKKVSRSLVHKTSHNEPHLEFVFRLSTGGEVNESVKIELIKFKTEPTVLITYGISIKPYGGSSVSTDDLSGDFTYRMYKNCREPNDKEFCKMLDIIKKCYTKHFLIDTTSIFNLQKGDF